MKKALPALVLLLLLIGGYGYADSQNFFREQAEEALKPAHVTGDQIVGLAYTGEEEVELHRTDGGGWSMEKPYPFPVKDYAADQAAHAFAGLEAVSIVDEAPADLGVYGLEHPAETIEATLKDGTKVTYQIGDPMAVLGHTYLKVAGSSAVYKVNDVTLANIKRTSSAFYNKTAFPFAYEKVKAVKLSWKGKEWTLSKADAAKTVYETPWKLGTKDLKPEEGKEILAAVQAVEAEDLTELDPALQAVLFNAGKKADLTLQITEEMGGTEKQTVWKGMVDKVQVRFAEETGQWAYIIPVDHIQEMFEQGKK